MGSRGLHERFLLILHLGQDVAVPGEEPHPILVETIHEVPVFALHPGANGEQFVGDAGNPHHLDLVGIRDELPVAEKRKLRDETIDLHDCSFGTSRAI